MKIRVIRGQNIPEVGNHFVTHYFVKTLYFAFECSEAIFLTGPKNRAP